jgi:hypothetical protein
MEHLRQLYEMADRNGDGQVNKRELIIELRHNNELCEILGLPAHIRQEGESRRVFEEIFHSADRDDDQQLSWEEFVELCDRGSRNHQQTQQQSHQQQLQLQQQLQSKQQLRLQQQNHIQQLQLEQPLLQQQIELPSRSESRGTSVGMQVKKLQIQLIFDRFTFSVLARMDLCFHQWKKVMQQHADAEIGADANAAATEVEVVRSMHMESVAIAHLEQETMRIREDALHHENERLKERLEAASAQVQSLDQQVKLHDSVVAKLTAAMEQKTAQLKILSEATDKLKRAYRGRAAIRAMVRAVARALGRAFRKWIFAMAYGRSATVEEESMRMREQIEREKKEKAGRQMQYCLNKIVNSKYVQAWDRWHAVHEAMIRAGRVMHRTMCRFTSSLQVGGWERWLEVIAAEKHAAAVMQRCLLRMDNAFTGRALKQWHYAIKRTAEAHYLQDAADLAAARSQLQLSTQKVLTLQYHTADLERAATANKREHAAQMEGALKRTQQKYSEKLEQALRAKQQEHVQSLKRALQMDTISRAEQLAAMQLEHHAALDRTMHSSRVECETLKRAQQQREEDLSTLRLEQAEASAKWSKEQAKLTAKLEKQQRLWEAREEEHRLALLMKESQGQLRVALEEEQQQQAAQQQQQAAALALKEAKRKMEEGLAVKEEALQRMVETQVQQSQEREQQLEVERHQYMHARDEVEKRQQSELDAERSKTHTIQMQQQMLVLAHQEHEQNSQTHDQEQQQQFHDLLSAQRQHRAAAESMSRVRQSEVDALRASKLNADAQLVALSGQLRSVRRQLEDERDQQRRHTPESHRHLDRLMLLESQQTIASNRSVSFDHLSRSGRGGHSEQHGTGSSAAESYKDSSHTLRRPQHTPSPVSEHSRRAVGV